jgi:hypothetical protein
VNRVLIRLFLSIGAIAISLAMSLWWIGARSESSSRAGVATSLLANPQVRAMLTENLSTVIATEEGISRDEAVSYVSGLDETALRDLLEVAYGDDVLSGTTLSLAPGTTSDGSEIIPGLDVLTSLRGLSERAPGFMVLSLAASGGAFLFAQDRRWVLRRIGRSWLSAPVGVLVMSLAIPWVLGGRQEQWALVLSTWLDRDWDLRFPVAVGVVGVVVVGASFLVPRRLESQVTVPAEADR